MPIRRPLWLAILAVAVLPACGDGVSIDDPVPAKLVVGSIAAQTAGAPFSVTVTLVDTLNVPIVNPGVTNGTITLSLKTGTGTLGGTVTGTIPVGSSVATISGVTYTKAETGVSLEATASVEGVAATLAATSNTFTVNAAAASAVSIATQPASSATTGVAFTQQPSVQIMDAFGNLVAQAGIVVTAAIASGGGTLGGTTTATTNASGAATFTNLSITGTDGTRTLTFSAPSLTAATSTGVAVTAAPTVAPVLLEDFSTYTSTANFKTNPRGIWRMSDATNLDKVILDEAVGFGSSTKSLRYDWPNNAGACSDYTINPGFLNLGNGRTHVWVEFVVRFSTNFTVDHGHSGCAKEYKLAALGDINGSGRWNVPEMQAGKFVMGWPGNDAGFSSTTPVPTSLWNGQPHTFRVEAKLGTAGSPGIFRMWINGVQVVNQTGFITSASHAQINIFGPGLNLNQGSAIEMKMWWHRIALYTSNPGW